MSDLYTSLTHLKMAIRGEVPPITPLTESAKKIVREEFTLGMGALYEDEQHGLMCPVCGKYFHELSLHISKAHGDVSDSHAVKRALGIGRQTRLVSQKASAKRKGKRYDEAKRRRQLDSVRPKIDYEKAARSRDFDAQAQNVNNRNLRDRCEAQLRFKFCSLADRIGRTPTYTEFCDAFKGTGLQRYVIKLYGTWNNAKAQFGLPATPRERYTVSDVLDSLRAWHTVHGALPSRNEAKDPDRAPLICSSEAIKRALKADTWEDAMKRAAVLLGLNNQTLKRAG